MTRKTSKAKAEQESVKAWGCEREDRSLWQWAYPNRVTAKEDIAWYGANGVKPIPVLIRRADKRTQARKRK